MAVIFVEYNNGYVPVGSPCANPQGHRPYAGITLRN